LNIPLITWESSARAPGANSTVSAKFTFDPATNELTYNVTAAGFPEGDLLAASIHRTTKNDSGPAIAVLANHAFQSIAGTEKLSDPDREKLMSGGLYLRIASRSKSTDNMRISLKPPDRK
jgi:CHRD domain